MSNNVSKKLRVGRKPKFTEEDIDDVKNKINELLDWCEENNEHPTDALLQAHLGIRSDKYITRYRTGAAPQQIVPEIQELFQEYKLISQNDLIQCTLKKEYPQHFASFILQNNHGMTNKQEVESNGSTTIVIENDFDEE